MTPAVVKYLSQEKDPDLIVHGRGHCANPDRGAALVCHSHLRPRQTGELVTEILIAAGCADPLVLSRTGLDGNQENLCSRGRMSGRTSTCCYESTDREKANQLARSHLIPLFMGPGPTTEYRHTNVVAPGI